MICILTDLIHPPAESIFYVQVKKVKKVKRRVKRQPQADKVQPGSQGSRQPALA